jgi:hypothetical protein
VECFEVLLESDLLVAPVNMVLGVPQRVATAGDGRISSIEREVQEECRPVPQLCPGKRGAQLRERSKLESNGRPRHEHLHNCESLLALHLSHDRQTTRSWRRRRKNCGSRCCTRTPRSSPSSPRSSPRGHSKSQSLPLHWGADARGAPLWEDCPRGPAGGGRTSGVNKNGDSPLLLPVPLQSVGGASEGGWESQGFVPLSSRRPLPELPAHRGGIESIGQHLVLHLREGRRESVNGKACTGGGGYHFL